MAKSGERTSKYLAGDKLYHERARAALPLLVRQAAQSTTVSQATANPAIMRMRARLPRPNWLVGTA
jgi:hypothetical protein